MNRLIEYFITDTTVNVFVIAHGLPDIPVILQIPCSYTSLFALVKNFREAISNQDNVAELAAELGSLLVKPLVDRSLINPEERLFISPHRCLHYIPFAALSVDGQPLLRTNSIVYLPAGSMIGHFADKPISGSNCLIVKRAKATDNILLQQSFQRESDRIASLLKAQVLADEDANMSNIKSMAAGKRIIHFACHGVFDSERPESSGLLLSDENGHEKLIELSEIAQLPLRSELVTLAACETGISDQHPGDELVGLIRAATLAGAQSIIATLWPVHSLATEAFVTKFYSYFLDGVSKIDSMNLAQIDVMELEYDDTLESLRRELTSQHNALTVEAESLLRKRLVDLLLSSGRIDEAKYQWCKIVEILGNSVLTEAQIAQLDKDGVNISLGRSGPKIDSPVDTEIVGLYHKKDHCSETGNIRPYAHPYFWSPFILVGGWV